MRRSRLPLITQRWWRNVKKIAAVPATEQQEMSASARSLLDANGMAVAARGWRHQRGVVVAEDQ